MKSPSLIRPMFTLGIIVVFGAVASYLLVPGLHGTAAGLTLFFVLLLIGIAAVVWDLYRLGQELKAMSQKDKDKPDEPLS